jgi:hypothetical protein
VQNSWQENGRLNKPDRGPLLTVLALLFGLLAVSEVLKPLQASNEYRLYVFFPDFMEFVPAVAVREQMGFVFFGKRLSGTANAVVGPLFGLYLLVYAVGIWRMRQWALPMGAAYAVYVIANLTLFMMRDPAPMREGALFGTIYAVVAIGLSWGAVWLLSQRRAALA